MSKLIDISILKKLVMELNDVKDINLYNRRNDLREGIAMINLICNELNNLNINISSFRFDFEYKNHIYIFCCERCRDNRFCIGEYHYAISERTAELCYESLLHIDRTVNDLFNEICKVIRECGVDLDEKRKLESLLKRRVCCC